MCLKPVIERSVAVIALSLVSDSHREMRMGLVSIDVTSDRGCDLSSSRSHLVQISANTIWFQGGRVFDARSALACSRSKRYCAINASFLCNSSCNASYMRCLGCLVCCCDDTTIHGCVGRWCGSNTANRPLSLNGGL